MSEEPKRRPGGQEDRPTDAEIRRIVNRMELDQTTNCLQGVINYLNSLLEADRDAMSLLFNARVTCNREMCDHPRIPIPVPIEQYVKGSYMMGVLTPLSLINGMFGLLPGNKGRISVVYTLECTNGCLQKRPAVTAGVTCDSACPLKCGGYIVRDKIVRFEATKGPIRERAA